MAGSPLSSSLFVPLEDLATALDPRGPAVRGRFLPTELARGPWDEGSLHGGPVAALLAEAAQALLTGSEPDGGGSEPSPTRLRPADRSVDRSATSTMVVTRLSVELLRPVPLAPLALRAEVVRPGRKVQLVDAVLEASGRPVAWGRALGLRTRDAGEADAGGGLGPGPRAEAGGRLPPPEAGTLQALRAADYRGFHSAGAEVRFVRGAFDQPGPATAWVRLAAPVLPDRPPSPLQRAAAAADFGNGLSAVLSFEHWRFVNPDLTVLLARPPVGEWVAVEAVTDLGVPGTALARSILHDTRGPIGSAAQCLVVEPR